MELGLLVKKTSVLIISKIVTFFFGIIRAKISAIYLGTLGVGVISQLNYLTTSITKFTTLNMGSAVVKNIAANQDNAEITEVINSTLKTFLILVLFFMLVTTSLAVIFSKLLTEFLFGDILYYKFFFISLVSFPFLILNSIPFSILQAFKDTRSIAKSQIILIVIDLFAFVPLVIFYGINGAAIYAFATHLVALLINYLIAKKKYFSKFNITIKSILKATTNRAFIKELLTFSFFGLITSLATIFAEIYCRSLVVTHIGIDKLGVYAPVMAWAGLFTGFILPSFNTYLFPRYSQAKSKLELSGLMNDAVRLSTLLLVPLLFIGIGFKDYLIVLLYSKEFADAALFLPYHFIGVAFYVWYYSISISLTATGRIKYESIFVVTFALMNLAFAYLFIPAFGLYGYMIRSSLSSFIIFIIVFLYFYKSDQFRLLSGNIGLIIYLLTGAGVLILIDEFIAIKLLNAFVSLLFLFSTFFVINKYERNKILNVINFQYEKFK